MNLVILGPQGCGKGTQAELLSKKYNLEHIDVGRALRKMAQQETELGKKIYEIQNIQKALVPSDILHEVMHLELNSLPETKGAIVDGAPRTTDQIGYIEKVLPETGRKIDKVIFIDIPKAESIKRISKRFLCENCRKHFIMGQDIQSPKDKCPVCGGKIIQRADDTPEGMEKRLEIFAHETLPVIEHFRQTDKLVEVDGMQPIDRVFSNILDNLKK